MPQSRKYKSNSLRQAAYRKRQAAARRKELLDRGLPPMPKLSTMPGTARWTGAIERCAVLLDMVRDEMTDYYAERSEAWQQTWRADEHQDRIKAIERLMEKLEDLSF